LKNFEYEKLKEMIVFDLNIEGINEKDEKNQLNFYKELNINDNDLEIIKEDQSLNFSMNEENFLLDEVEYPDELEGNEESIELFKSTIDYNSLSIDLSLKNNNSLSRSCEYRIEDFFQKHLGNGVNKEQLKRFNKESLVEFFYEDLFKTCSKNKFKSSCQSISKKQEISKSMKYFKFSIDKRVNKSDIFVKAQSKSLVKRKNFINKKLFYNLYNFGSSLYIIFELAYFIISLLKED
jgi:hypothetical protein